MKEKRAHSKEEQTVGGGWGGAVSNLNLIVARSKEAERERKATKLHRGEVVSTGWTEWPVSLQLLLELPQPHPPIYVSRNSRALFLLHREAEAVR